MSGITLPDRFNLGNDDEEDKEQDKPEKSVPSRKLSPKKERTNDTNQTPVHGWRPSGNTDSLVLTAGEFTRAVHPDLKRVPVNGQGAEYLKEAIAWYAKKRRMTLTDARDAALKAFIPVDIQESFFQKALTSSGYQLTEADYYPGKYDPSIEDEDDDIDG